MRDSRQGEKEKLRIGEKSISFFATSMPMPLKELLLGCPAPLLILLSNLYASLVEPPIPDEEFVPLLPLVELGSTVLEVGSNKGGLTKLLSSRVGKTGRVISCEPNPVSYSIAKQNLKRAENTTVLNVGVWRSNSPRIMQTVGLTDSAASQYSQRSRVPVMRFRAHFVTLDWLLRNLNITRLDTLIIDAEGSELEIIEGGMGVIRRSQELAIQIELHPSLRRGVDARVMELLSSLGYRALHVSSGRGAVTFLFKKFEPHAKHRPESDA